VERIPPGEKTGGNVHDLRSGIARLQGQSVEDLAMQGIIVEVKDAKTAEAEVAHAASGAQSEHKVEVVHPIGPPRSRHRFPAPLDNRLDKMVMGI
jgi:hypothetical protein